jgi:hypothetical protein
MLIISYLASTWNWKIHGLYSSTFFIYKSHQNGDISFMHKYYVPTMQKWYLENKGVQIKHSFFFVPSNMVSLNKLKLLCTHGWPRTFADERLVLIQKNNPGEIIFILAPVSWKVISKKINSSNAKKEIKVKWKMISSHWPLSN